MCSLACLLLQPAYASVYIALLTTEAIVLLTIYCKTASSCSGGTGTLQWFYVALGMKATFHGSS